MDIDAARSAIVRAAGAGPTGLQTARSVLIDRGMQALSIAPSHKLSLDDIVRTAVTAAPTEGRRDFAVLLVHACGIKNLLPAHGETERAIHAFLECALLNPLRRAGYPFAGTRYEKRQVLAGLHATIGDHLRKGWRPSSQIAFRVDSHRESRT